jgi:DNA polymerase
MTEMDKAKELLKVAEEIGKCRICKKWGIGKPVPGEGNPDAEVAFVGEAPGKEEAATGRPFVGRSGRLLRAMITKIGLREQDVFITSPVKYLPLSGTPSRENINHSRGHLKKQLSVIGPRVIVLLGNTACSALLDAKIKITDVHGVVITENERTYFITFHPAYALRFPEGKKGFIEDFEKLKRVLKT